MYNTVHSDFVLVLRLLLKRGFLYMGFVPVCKTQVMSPNC